MSEIVWQKNTDEAIVSYHIYREITGIGSFTDIGQVISDSLGYYVDLSSNNDNSYSYYLSTIDTCGNEFVSNMHNSLSLSFDSTDIAADFTINPYIIENDTLGHL